MTLLESCASIAVISTAVFFTTPSLINTREHYHLDAVARQVAGKMHSTRIKAISRSRDCRMRVNSPSSYVIECQESGWHLNETVALPQGFRISASATPEFHMRGNVAPAATITIWNHRSKTRRVIVNITGRVRVE